MKQWLLHVQAIPTVTRKEMWVGGGRGITHPEEILLLCHLALDAVLHRPPSFHVHILLVVGQHL